MGILHCAIEACGDEEFRWKLGHEAALAIRMQEVTVGPIEFAPPRGTPERIAWDEKYPPRELGTMDFCGLPGKVQGRGFSPRRMELHSPTRGHVGTVELAPESAE